MNKKPATKKDYENAIDSDLTEDEKLYKYALLLGKYSIVGLQTLQNTYSFNGSSTLTFDNSVFTLQLFILLLKNGINGIYSDELLPENFIPLLNNGLLDDSKIEKIWEKKHIIDLGETFKKYFDSKIENDSTSFCSNEKKILEMLSQHDVIFQQFIME